MTTTTSGPSPSSEALEQIEQPLSKAGLPRWTPWAALAAALVVAVVVTLPAGSPLAGVAVMALRRRFHTAPSRRVRSALTRARRSSGGPVTARVRCGAR